jgi:RNA polymerase sigma factor (sigma-70 family)
LQNKLAQLNAEYQIWENIKDGDRESLKELYELYYITLVNYGRKITDDQALIEDAIQETYISIWKYRLTMSVPASVKHYVLRAFRNRLTQIFKERPNITYTEESLNFSFEVGFDHKIIEGEDARKLSAQINKAVSKLTNRQREIIYYRFYENLSFEEIAEIMSMQIRATYKLNARAITSLREILGTTLLNFIFPPINMLIC